MASQPAKAAKPEVSASLATEIDYIGHGPCAALVAGDVVPADDLLKFVREHPIADELLAGLAMVASEEFALDGEDAG